MMTTDTSKKYGEYTEMAMPTTPEKKVHRILAVNKRSENMKSNKKKPNPFLLPLLGWRSLEACVRLQPFPGSKATTKKN